MKRIIGLLAILFISTSLFAENGFFGQRYFEVDLKLPVSVSNTAFCLDDIMVKDCVIDLGKIADNMPKSGYSAFIISNPSIGLNLNLSKFSAGINFNIQNYEKFTIPKGFFDFLGKGNDLNEELDFAPKFNGDIFADLSVNVQVPLIKGITIKVTPSLFMPLLHVTTEQSKMTLVNTTDGEIKFDLDAQAKIYTCLSGFDLDSFDLKKLLEDTGFGFDLGGEVAFPLKDHYTLSGAFRIPVVPGRMKYVCTEGVKYNFSTKFTDLLNGGLDFNTSPEITNGNFEDANYIINRPLKFDVGFDMAPMGNFMHLNYGLGFGIRNLFMGNEELVFYPEYSIACTLQLSNIIGGTISTEYTDENFQHTFAFYLNIRMFELDASFSFTAPTIYGSVSGAGFAATIETKFGF